MRPAGATTAELARAAGDGIVLRRVETRDEYAECVRLQDQTWGAGFSERVPATMLKVAQYVGGVTAGAFDADGRLLGFVFGLTGVRDGRLVHWSDLLAVRPEARDHGLGRRLKLYQRELVRAIGVETMLWTYDPLVAKNAHLNLNRLGVRVAEYVEDMYGSDTGSVLHGALGTDRFVVQWDLAAPSVSATSPAVSDLANEGPIVGAAAGDDGAASGALPDAAVVRVEIPADINALIAHDSDAAWRWRLSTRRAFTYYLPRGYVVERVVRDEDSGRVFYRLSRRPS